MDWEVSMWYWGVVMCHVCEGSAFRFPWVIIGISHLMSRVSICSDWRKLGNTKVSSSRAANEQLQDQRHKNCFRSACISR